MSTRWVSVLLLGAWCAATAAAPAVPSPDGPAATAADEIIVRGRGFGELRLQVQRAEQAVYDRFNAINSDDRFDISCEWRARLGSRMEEYTCLSNSWREQDANIATSLLQGLQGMGGGLGDRTALFVSEQLRMQRALRDEMRRLALTDADLRAAVESLGEAYQLLANLSGARSSWSFYREMPRRDDGLPFDAQRAFEVQIGAQPWSQPLLGRTFTLGDVSGNIRRMEVACERHVERISYEPGTDWTIPESWGACLLRVAAKRDTTFRFYEFQ